MLLDRIIALETKMSVLEAKELKHQKPSPPTFHTPNISFIDWVKSLEPTREHLEHVLSQGYIQGMSIILCALIEQSLDPPIQINHSKKNQLYVYQLNKWSISENKQFEMFVDVIQFKLFKLFLLLFCCVVILFLLFSIIFHYVLIYSFKLISTTSFIISH